MSRSNARTIRLALLASVAGLTIPQVASAAETATTTESEVTEVIVTAQNSAI